MLKQMLRPILGPLIRPLRQRVFLTKIHISSRMLGLTPIDQFDADDIFIAGYLKSGNTWMQYLMAGLVYGVNATLAPDPLIQDLVVEIPEHKFYQRYSTPCFFKTHHLPRPEYKRVIFLLRDGRDVMVSLFHYLQAKGQEVSFERMITHGEGLYPCKWHEYVTAWLDNPYGAKMLLLRYEDLKKNPVAELQRCCEFCGIERDEKWLEECVRNASFENMRAREIKMGWRKDLSWPKDKFFVRRGVVGSHKDEMPAELLNRFCQDSAEVLKKTGYLE